MLRFMQPNEKTDGSWLAAVGLRLSRWLERWFPDAFALALSAVALVFAASVARGNAAIQTAEWFGAGFWDLTTFTLQITMIIVYRVRGSDGAAGLRADPAHGGGSQAWPERGGLRGAVFHGLLPAFLELQPDF